MDYHDIIARAIAAESRPAEWITVSGRDEDDPWIRVRNVRHVLPPQGWKLHVSAYVANSHKILSRVLPTLLREEVTFKVIRNPSMLSELNLGSGGRSQIGKFITVYPAQSQDPVQIATQLAGLTRDGDGPVVLSDRRLPGSKTVYYRYGSFGGLVTRTLLGDYVPALLTPTNQRVVDTVSSYCQPAWVTDPFNVSEETDPLSIASTDSVWIGDRFVLIAPIYQTKRGRIYLAIDIEGVARCVLKMTDCAEVAHGHGYTGVDLLAHEYDVLCALAPAGVGPKPLEFGYLPHGAYLAMEDLPGRTLTSVVQALASSLDPRMNDHAFELGDDVARLIGSVHANGIVYRDLKSSNVIVGEDGSLRLVDFELAHALDDPSTPFGRGTLGYMSPQQEAGEVPSISDDIYGLGAILYYAATGAEPSAAPRPSALLDRSPVLLSPGTAGGLQSVISRALQYRPSSRFDTTDEFRNALTSVRDSSSPMSVKQPMAVSGDHELQWNQLARRAGLAVCADGLTTREHRGRAWLTRQSQHPRVVPSRDLGNGTAGVVLCLAHLYSELRDEELRSAASEGCQWLIGTDRIEGKPLSGMFVGDAGVSLALLRAGVFLGVWEFVEAALRHALEVVSAPHTSPDLYHGTAGRIFAHLALWEETGSLRQLEAAVDGGEVLLAGAEHLARGHLAWHIPPGYGSLSGERWLGYAHGAAGIGHALVRLYKATGDVKFRVAVRHVGAWLLSHAVVTGVGRAGLAWPTSPGRQSPTAPVWCHGSGGIGRFFLAAAAADAIPGAMEVAMRSADAVAQARWIGPTQCHGLAGAIDFLLDMHVATGSMEYLIDAKALAGLLETFLIEERTGTIWPLESGRRLPADYIVGYSGIASCLLRLGTAGRVPSLLGDP